MAYTETSYQSIFGRLGNAIKGVIAGLVLVPVSIILLFWNEGRAVHMARTLAEGKSAVVAVDSGKVDPANDGKLVHFTGRAVNAGGDKLVDPVFHISADAIHLRRNVMMYAWKEEKHTESHKDMVGGGTTTNTTYSYNKIWTKQPIDSSEFKESGHTNPGHWRFESNTQNAPKVTVGAFTLDGELAGKIDNFTAVPVSSDTLSSLSSDLKDDTISLSDTLYVSNDPGHKPSPDSPQVGDLRVSFEAALPGDVSVIARQTADRLAPYQTQNNALELLYVGNHSADEMFKSEEVKNSHLTWILRGVGFVVMWIGLGMLLSPFKVLSDVVGIVGDIVGAGIALITGVIAVALSSGTIAIAWIAYRPIVGIGMLAVTAAAIVLFFVLRSRGAAQRRVGIA